MIRMRLGNRRAAATAAILLGGVLAVVISGTVAEAATKAPTKPGSIVPVNSKYAGKTYGQWAGRWWQWAVSVPTATNPLLDSTGAHCAEGQTGPVWFLAGTLGPGSAERTCTVPADKAIFFPIINAFSANDPGLNKTYDEVLNEARAFLPDPAGSATIDGHKVENVGQYYVESPAFRLVLPDDNIFGAPAGAYSPAAAVGIHLLLTPLTSGQHTIEFTGSTSAPDSTVHVIYHLTVTEN